MLVHEMNFASQRLSNTQLISHKNCADC